MNKHIELVKKWLADRASVSQEELRASYHEAVDAAHAPDVAKEADYAAAYAAARAANSAFDYHAAARAAYWVEEYEELTNAE